MSEEKKQLSRAPDTVRNSLLRHGYSIGKILGTGAYATVRVATTLDCNQKEVAVKLVNKSSAPQDVLHKFLPREIDILKKIHHPNVVKLLDVIQTENFVCLVMEYAQGGDLLDFINARRNLSNHLARKLFLDLILGVEACHSMQIVHRDLKCENLLIDSQQKLIISDFGFARQHEGQRFETYCGSYAYAAPEVILGEPYIGTGAYIWSMGVILYAMVVGRLPFKDSDVKLYCLTLHHVLHSLHVSKNRAEI